MLRPRGVTFTFVLMCGTTAVDDLLILRHRPHAVRSVLIYSLIVAACYIVLWFYRQGRNWARWIVLLLCAQSLWALLSLIHRTQPTTRSESLTTASEAGAALLLIWYLNTTHVRRWFQDSRNQKSIDASAIT